MYFELLRPVYVEIRKDIDAFKAVWLVSEGQCVTVLRRIIKIHICTIDKTIAMFPHQCALVSLINM